MENWDGRGLEKLIAELPERVDAVNERVARRIAKRARAAVSGYDPKLARSVRVNRNGEGAEDGWAVLEGRPRGKGARFEAHLVEYGSVHNAPHPHLTPAAESEREAHLREMRDAVQ